MAQTSWRRDNVYVGSEKDRKRCSTDRLKVLHVVLCKLFEDQGLCELIV